MLAQRNPVAVVALLLVLSGCAGHAPGAPWGPRLPEAGQIGGAASRAARSPATWVPLAAAAALAVAGDADEELSEWAGDHTPLFGRDAEAVSDDLRTAALVAYGVTALAAPAERFRDRVGGVLVGAVALTAEDLVTDTVKTVSDRERPDGSDHESFTSGHAGTSSAASTLARRNLGHLTLPGWIETSARVGLHGLAGATGWARVEAERHHVTDVLAGYAVGHFVADFFHHAFMAPAVPPLQVSVSPVGRGGVVTVAVALQR
ncbi:MAG: phosphatase PAP2 family protein [Pseudomonadota bacterium]